MTKESHNSRWKFLQFSEMPDDDTFQLIRTENLLPTDTMVLNIIPDLLSWIELRGV